MHKLPIEVKGNIGEELIITILKYNSGLKILLKNIYLFNEKDEICEIDIIMLHETGIYVFESKNYSGWIFGNEKDKTWTQVLANKQKNKFYNPIKQNNKHIAILHSIIKDPYMPYYNVIVFGNNCRIKNITTTSTVHVCKIENLFGNTENNIIGNKYKIPIEVLNNTYYKIMNHTITNQNIINKRNKIINKYK